MKNRNFYRDPNSGAVFEYDDQQVVGGLVRSGLVEMTAEEVEAHLNPAQPVVVPGRVTMRQARLALHAAGLLVQVEAAIEALPEPPRTEARIEWDYSSEVFRDRDFVKMLGASLGLTSEQMDDLFITAATL